MSDFNLYEDLDEFEKQHEKKSKELQEAEEKYQQSLKTIEELKAENKTLKKNIQRAELGFQSLLDTARSEIKRKDKEIERLRKEKDDICFRRKIYTKSANTNNDSRLVNNSNLINPSKHNDAKRNERLLRESAVTTGEVCEDHTEKREKNKRNIVDAETEDRSDYKKHKGLLYDDGDKHHHGINRQRNVSQKVEEDYQSNRLRYRENNRNKIYEKDYGRNRSRERAGHEKVDSRSRYDKSSKPAERRDRYDKESRRNSSRERDKSDYNRKNLEERRRSRERRETKTLSKSSSKSPSKRSKADASTKHHIKTETENSKKVLNKDLGEETSTNLQTEHNKSSAEKLPMEQENRIKNVNSHFQTEKIQKQENQKSISISQKDELPNSFASDFPKELHEAKSSEKSVPNTPQRLAIFNEIFGKSPSLCESISRIIKEKPAQSTHIELISSATTSSANYTDIDGDVSTPISRTAETVTSASGPSCETPNDEVIWLEKKSKNDINECFTLNPTISERNFKTISCVDLTNIDEADMANEIDFIQIPGLDLCPKKKLAKSEGNTNTLLPISENLETCNKETDITIQKITKENPSSVFNEVINPSNFNTTQLKENLDIKNSDNVTILIADGTATTDKIGVINKEDNFASRNPLLQSTDVIQNLESNNCMEKNFNKTPIIYNDFCKEQVEIMTCTKSGLTNELVVIDAKQCGGAVPLKNPYRIREDEQKSLNSNNSKPDKTFVNIEIDSNSEKQEQKRNFVEGHNNENKKDDNMRQIESFSPGVSNPAAKYTTEESFLEATNDEKSFKIKSVTLLSNKEDTVVQNEEIKLTRNVSNPPDISNTKSNAKTFLERDHVQGDELNPSFFNKENSIKLPQESDQVMEGIEMKDNNEAKNKTTAEELHLNKKEVNEAKDKSKKCSKGEKRLNEEMFETKAVLLTEDNEKENASKAVKEICEKEKVNTNVRKKHEQFLDDTSSNILSTEHSAKNDILKQVTSATTEQPTAMQKTVVTLIQKEIVLTNLDCPVSTKNQRIQNKIMKQAEEKSLGKDVLSPGKSCTFKVDQETSTNMPEKYLKNDQFKKVNSIEVKSSLDTAKFNTDFKVVELPALMKDNVIEKEGENFANSAGELTNNDPKVSIKSSKIIVQSVEMLPPIQVLQKESFRVAKGKEIPSCLTSAENLSDRENLHTNLKFVKSASQIVQNDEEEFTFVAIEKEKPLIKELLHKNVQIVDFCTPIKKSETGDESSKDDYITRERSVKKHTHAKDLTITIPNEKHFPQAKILQKATEILTTMFPPIETCLPDKSVENLVAKKSLDIEDESNLSSNAEQYHKIVLHEKSLSNESLPANSQIQEISSSKEAETKVKDIEVLRTVVQNVLHDEVTDTLEQNALETLSRKSIKNEDITKNVIFAKTSSLCVENAIKETDLINVSSDDVDNSTNEDKSTEATAIIVQSKQSEDLQNDIENQVTDTKQHSVSATINQTKSIKHISEIVISEDLVKAEREKEEGNLCDSMEILLNKIHGIQDGHDNSVILKVSDLDLADEIKDTSEETETLSTVGPIATYNTNITQIEQPNAKNTSALLLDMQQNDSETKVETVNNTVSKTETLSCPSTKPSGKLLTSASYQEENFKGNSCDSNITSINKKDGKNEIYSFTPAADEEMTSSLSKQTEVQNNCNEIKTEAVLVEPSHAEEGNTDGAISGNANLNLKELKTYEQSQSLICLAETSPTEIQDRKSCEANETFYSKDSALANCGPKQTKDPPCKDIQKVQIVQSVNTDLSTEKETTINSFITVTEPCTDLFTNINKVAISNQNELEMQFKTGRQFAAGSDQKSCPKGISSLKEATQNTAENTSTGYVANDKQCDSTTREIKTDVKTTLLLPLNLNAHYSSQGFADTNKIIYLKKVVSKEINMEGEIVEVVKDIIDFDETQTAAKMIKQIANNSNKEQNTTDSARNRTLRCDYEQNIEDIPQQQQQQPVSFECRKDVLPANLQEASPTLPSISAVFPTPSNFSGIFSKLPPTIGTNDDELNKSKKKSVHLNTKPKEYILPAASVLCNVDNLENATKNNKKLHWELLDNKSEMTEIEDDAEIDTTDNEELERKETPFERPPSSPKQKNLRKSSPSETDTQTEDESLLNDIRQKKGKYKELNQFKSPKSKSPKTIKVNKAKATAIQKVNANVDDALPLQESSLKVPSKRPVGRPRKLDKPITYKKKSRKPNKIDESNVVESSSKLDNNKKDPTELKQNSVESSNVERNSEQLTTQACFPKSSINDGNYNDNTTKSVDGNHRNILNDLKGIEDSVSPAEKLEISNEPCNPSDSFKQRKNLETQVRDSANQDYNNISLVNHKQQSSNEGMNTTNENNSAAIKEQIREKIDYKVITTVDERSSEVTSGSRELQNSVFDKGCNLVDKTVVEDEIIPDGLNVLGNDILVSSIDRSNLEIDTKTRSCTELAEQQKENFAKSKSSISNKNKGKTVISLEDIGINVRPPKVHLSSFRIPKIKRNPEDEVNSGWKLEQYVELENMENKNQTQEKVTQDRKFADENELKECCLASTSANVYAKTSVDKKQSTSNSTELIFKENVQLQSEKVVQETPKSLSNIDTTNYGTKTGRRKLYSADIYDDNGAGFVDRTATKTETKSVKGSSKPDLTVVKTSQPDLVKHRRKSVSSLISKPVCDEIKSPDDNGVGFVDRTATKMETKSVKGSSKPDLAVVKASQPDLVKHRRKSVSSLISKPVCDEIKSPDDNGVGFVDRTATKTETKSVKGSSKPDLTVFKKLQPDLVKNRRKSVSSLISKPVCDEIKSPESSTKPLQKSLKSHRRILYSNSDEDIEIAAKKIKLSTSESNKAQDQTISRDLQKNATHKRVRMRSKSLYTEIPNMEGTDIELDKCSKAKSDPRISREQKTVTKKLQLPDIEKNHSNNQQPTEAVVPLKSIKKSLNASKESPKQVKQMTSEACSQKNSQQSSVYVEHSASEITAQKSENKAEDKVVKKEKNKDSTQQAKRGSDLAAISTHADGLGKRRRSTNQKTNFDDNKASDTTQRRTDPRLNLDAGRNVKAYSNSASVQSQPEEIKLAVPAASQCQNLKPESNITLNTPNEENELKQSREDHQISTTQKHKSSCMDTASDASATLTLQEDEPVTKIANVNKSAEESEFLLAKQPKLRRRRVVKVLSTSMYSPNTSANISKESLKQFSPFASPLLNHPIFNNEVSTQSTEFAMTLPLTPNHQDDSELKEIDSKLNELFKSPIHTTDNVDKNLSSAASANLSILPPHLNSSQSMPIKEHTPDVSRQNDCSTLNNSQLNNSSMPLNDTQTLPEVKYLSMGSSKYRFEKVSDNVVNLFITRKRKRK